MKELYVSNVFEVTDGRKGFKKNETSTKVKIK